MLKAICTSFNKLAPAIVMPVIVFVGILEFNFAHALPDFDSSGIIITTWYVGASADVIESQITEPLKNVISRIAGIRSLTSISREGRSLIVVEFELSVNLKAAVNDVRNQVSQASKDLPPEVTPVVEVMNANSSSIIFMATISSEERSLGELSEIVENSFKERLQTLFEANSLQILGQSTYFTRLWIDTVRLTAFNLASSDVLEALNKENVELAIIPKEGSHVKLTIRTMGRFSSPVDLNNLIIKNMGNDLFVRFADIGRVELELENEAIVTRNGVRAIAIIVQFGTNKMDIVKKLDQIKRELPSDIVLNYSPVNYK